MSGGRQDTAPRPTPRATQAERDEVTLRAMPFVAGFVIVGYSVIGIGHLLLLPDAIKYPLAALAILTALAGAIAFAAVQMEWIGAKQANFVATAISALIIANSGLHIYLSGEPHQAVNIGLTAAGLGLIHLSVRHFVLSYAGLLVIWFAAALPVLNTEEAGHYGYFVFNASILATIAFMVRWYAFNAMITSGKESEQRQADLEKALHRARMAEATLSEERAKRDFLSTVSHELRTPLNAIIGFSGVLKQELFGPVGSQENKEYIAEIEVAGLNLLRTLNDILDLASAQFDELEIDPHLFDLEDAIESAVFAARSRERHRVRVEQRVSAAVRTIVSDERRIKQIVAHLASNAIKFSHEDGEVWIEAGFQPPRGVFIRIRDDGCGMTKEQVAHALKPFSQVDRGLAREFDGIGIGLPLSNELADRLGGSLEIESRPDEGTLVTVWLPLTCATGAGRPVLVAS